MDKISNGENDPVFFLSEGAPSQNLICPLLGFFSRVFFAGAPLPFSISWRYAA
jgi:hypothetical protein